MRDLFLTSSVLGTTGCTVETNSKSTGPRLRRNQLITVTSSTAGALFTTKHGNGTFVDAELSLIELRFRYRQLYQSYRDSVDEGSVI